MQLPNNIGELFKAALDIESAQKKGIVVNLFVDESASSELRSFVQMEFTSESPLSHVGVCSVPSQVPDIEAPCDIAVVVAGDSVEAVALVSSLASIETPTLVIAESLEALLARAESMGHPLDKGNIVSLKKGKGLADSEKERLALEMGTWIVEQVPDQKLAFAHAFAFVRKPLALSAVNATAAQNAGIGLVVFVPGADMPIMTINQAKMVLQIAAAYGHPLSKDRIKELAATLGSAFVFRGIARQAAGFIPALGWAIKMTMGYVGTVTIGKTAVSYFENGGDAAGVIGMVGSARKSVFKKASSLKGQSFKEAATAQAYCVADGILEQAQPVLSSATDSIAASVKSSVLHRKKKNK